MMYGRVSVVIALSAIAFAGGSPAVADGYKTLSSKRSPAFMRIYGNASPPYGFVRFCDGHPDECIQTGSPNDVRYEATPERLSELDQVNRLVNKTIEPATDMEIYGVNELWTIPTTRGDCEDFALLKRRMLMDRGWPAGALLMTVVRDEKNEGHAILTARTTQGDFVLDNKNEEVKLWTQTPYHYVMRQSYINPRVWVSLDPSDASQSAAVAGVQANPEPFEMDHN
ncbi:MAG: transglutaminase-like cysteine peptidase [Hyphomicrobiaceae bacterium]|nr:transglutaminase-like cysteine peptidase [Hyphomicrobiaceae bacterium]